LKKEREMVNTDYDVYSAMQDGEPLAVYRKGILGKVHVISLNPFTDEAEGVILEGNPAKAEEIETQVIELWTAKSKLFFERMNKKHIAAGRLNLVQRAALPKAPPSPNIISDEEINKLLNSKFLALKARLDKFTDSAPVFRILNRARELDKSEKIVKHIEEKISQLQLQRYEVEKVEEE
jgi:hypothetical protein